MSPVPTSVYAEMTPNPAAMKFVANRVIIEGDHTAEYNSAAEAKGSSGLAEELFSFPFVTGVFVAGNFVSIAKNDSISWDLVSMQVRDFVREHLTQNQWAVQVVPEGEANPAEKSATTVKVEPTTDVEKEICTILDEFVRPAVEGDGGAIDFKSFDEGIVTVTLRGACSGCPSSTITLKSGIESLLRSKLPEVKEVVAEEL